MSSLRFKAIASALIGALVLPTLSPAKEASWAQSQEAVDAQEVRAQRVKAVETQFEAMKRDLPSAFRKVVDAGINTELNSRLTDFVLLREVDDFGTQEGGSGACDFARKNLLTRKLIYSWGSRISAWRF